MSVFADDYQAEVEIEGEKFVFRKISVADQYDLQDQSKSDTNFFRNGVFMVLKSLKSWTIKDKDGKILPINEENIKRFRMDIMRRLTEESIKINNISEADLKNSQARLDSSPKDIV